MITYFSWYFIGIVSYYNDEDIQHRNKHDLILFGFIGYFFIVSDNESTEGNLFLGSSVISEYNLIKFPSRKTDIYEGYNISQPYAQKVVKVLNEDDILNGFG